MATKPNKSRKYNKRDIYRSNTLIRKIYVEFSSIGQNLNEVLIHILKKNYEGKCNKEGFIKRDSINIISYNGGLMLGNHVIYDVVFKCKVCNPPQGMLINCNIVNITKAGIRAIYGDNEDESPLIIFIARDHNYDNEIFNGLDLKDTIKTRVIGTRYELNDNKIHVISELIPMKKKK